MKVTLALAHIKRSTSSQNETVASACLTPSKIGLSSGFQTLRYLPGKCLFQGCAHDAWRRPTTNKRVGDKRRTVTRCSKNPPREPPNSSENPRIWSAPPPPLVTPSSQATVDVLRHFQETLGFAKLAGILAHPRQVLVTKTGRTIQLASNWSCVASL